MSLITWKEETCWYPEETCLSNKVYRASRFRIEKCTVLPKLFQSRASTSIQEILLVGLAQHTYVFMRPGSFRWIDWFLWSKDSKTRTNAVCFISLKSKSRVNGVLCKFRSKALANCIFSLTSGLLNSTFININNQYLLWSKQSGLENSTTKYFKIKKVKNLNILYAQIFLSNGKKSPCIDFELKFPLFVHFCI